MNTTSAPTRLTPLAPPRPALRDSTYLQACAGGSPRHTPVWFQRQAGRSLPEYRKLREGKTFEQMLTNPELAAEVTLQPVRRHNVDAAIFFSDIITSVASFCEGITIEPNRGPVISKPFRCVGDLGRLEGFEPERHVPYVVESVERVVAELDPIGVPLIGFAGAPFTVATYLVEGGKSKEFEHTKEMMHARPEVWFGLMDLLAEIAIKTLSAQITHGASAVQLFDSWAGILSRREYETFAAPASRKVFAAIESFGVPMSHFGVGTGELLGSMARVGADVVGVDFRVSLADARARVGSGVVLQGNLDPTIALCPVPVVTAEVSRILSDAGLAGGSHIFNLGHGVLPQTDPDVLTAITRQVHVATASK